jgi:hypothetical protein
LQRRRLHVVVRGRGQLRLHRAGQVYVRRERSHRWQRVAGGRRARALRVRGRSRPLRWARPPGERARASR